MWTRNNDVSNWNMLKHFIYSSSSKSTTSSLCLLYYRYSSKLSSFFYILSFLVKATSIDQTFYSATYYLATVWLDSRHDLNIKLSICLPHDINFITHSSYSMNNETSIKKFVYLIIDDIERQNNIRESIESTRTYDHWIVRESIAHSIASIHSINRINENIWSLIARESQIFLLKKLVNQLSQNNLCHQIQFNLIQIQVNLVSLLQRRCQCDDLPTHIALSISELIYLMFLCQLVSLPQWHDQNRHLQWASRFSSSESATKTLSMQWFIYSHRSIYQWINLSHVYLQLVSLLQWHDQNQSLQWASWFSSSESATKTLSMQWFIYSHCLIYQ